MAAAEEIVDEEIVDEIDSPLEGADEDFNNLSLEQLEAMVAGDPADEAEETEEDEDTTEDTDDVEDEPAEDEEKIAADATDDGEVEPDTELDTDYQAQMAEIMAPFRANNRDMQVDSVEDARRLMQMGANYNKKMAGLKPNLKLMKMLENNDLLSEEKLSYLIDINKKDPAAITKMLKESGVDPDDIDLEAEDGYKVNNTYTVNDKEVELDGILEEIQDTTSFNQTIDIISNKWDERSKQLVLDQPEAIRHINDHIESGIYDRITAVVEQEKALGRLTGLSDLEAYKEVGDAIHASGGFDTPESNTAETKAPTKTTKAQDSKLRSKKNAASSTKSAATTGKGKEEFNPLSLSDEDFEKVSSKYI